MKKNMGTTDRIIRAVISVVLLALFFTHVLHGILGIIALIIAIVLLVTALIGYCPLYKFINCSTCGKDHCDDEHIK